MDNNTIDLEGIPCFDNESVKFELAKSNFIYGPNGSGKSSIARKIKKLHAEESDNSVSVLVFNQQYIQQFIDPDSEIPGVFTVRAGSPEVQERLRQLEGTDAEAGEIAQAEQKLQGLNSSYEKQIKNLSDAVQTLEKEVWELKKSVPESLQQHAFKGLLNNRKRFAEEAIRRFKTQSDQNDQDQGETERSLEKKLSLLSNADSSDQLELIGGIPEVPEIPESVASILAKPLSEDSSNRLSMLISKLGNSEWVRTGVDHLDHSDGLCPFCQQKIKDVLEDELRSLFDSEYETARGAVERLKDDFADYFQRLDSYVEHLRELEMIDTDSLEKVLLRHRSEIESVARKLEEKLTDMSKVIDQVSVLDLNGANEKLDKINKKIAQHNSDIQDRDKALTALKNSIWSYFLSKPDVSAALNTHKGKIEGPNNAISGLTPKVRKAEESLDALRRECAECKGQLTSAIDVKEEINRSLEGLGFTSFRLGLIDNDSKYRIERDNGQIASMLSEGEKTLISFLYFYQRAKDAISDRTSGRKVWVVLDDPISSLDVQSLTVVSHLCRDLASLSERAESNLERFFLLTHNAYFYQEAIYEGGRRKNPDSNRRLYSLIRKCESGFSEIESSAVNKIESTYELLWRDIRDARKNTAVVSASVQNAMRRVLEVYFRLIGSDEDDILDQLGVELQLPAKSLLSWINDGSHQIRWDLDSAQTNLDNASHFRVFEEIFRVTGQSGHYNMMMKQGVEGNAES